MKKTKQTDSKLLVIAITTAAIIAAVTTTTISTATPAFAKTNCNEDNSICSGGQSNKKCCGDVPGGAGGRGDEDSVQGGFGGQVPTIGGGTLVGGEGGHCDADTGQCVGSSGQHLKGPGGNSD